jgi:hypothetical protein
MTGDWRDKEIGKVQQRPAPKLSDQERTKDLKPGANFCFDECTGRIDGLYKYSTTGQTSLPWKLVDRRASLSFSFPSWLNDPFLLPSRTVLKAENPKI